MQQRLRTKADANYAEPQNGDGHGSRTRHDETTDPAADEGRDDKEVFPAPVVGCLGDDGTQNDGEDGDGRGEPDRLGGGVKVGGYCLALLFRAEKEVSRAQVFRNQRGAE